METSATSPLSWPYMDVALQWAKIGLPFTIALLILALFIALLTYLIKIIAYPFSQDDAKKKDETEKK